MTTSLTAARAPVAPGSQLTLWALDVDPLLDMLWPPYAEVDRAPSWAARAREDGHDG